MAKKKLSAREEVNLMNQIAERLSAVRRLINNHEERFKQETDELYREEKQLREDILLGLKTMGLSSVRTESGESYFIAHTYDFEITDPLAYEVWARENRCVSIDKRLAKQRLLALSKEDQVPAFANPVPRDTINVRSPKKENNE